MRVTGDLKTFLLAKLTSIPYPMFNLQNSMVDFQYSMLERLPGTFLPISYFQEPEMICPTWQVWRLEAEICAIGVQYVGFYHFIGSPNPLFQ